MGEVPGVLVGKMVAVGMAVGGMAAVSGDVLHPLKSSASMVIKPNSAAKSKKVGRSFIFYLHNHA
jgi:hypothetical protein